MSAFGTPERRRSSLVAAILFVTAISLAGSAAAREPARPSFYAFENARVAVGDGTVLERATVLVGDGLIEGIGPDLEIPADAWVIDAEGLTLYPGLIDPLSPHGLADETGGERGGGRGGGGRRGGGDRDAEPAPVRGPESRPRTTPWREAADHLDPEADHADWRAAGFTAAAVTFDDGFFSGRSSLIHLGSGEGSGDSVDRVLARGLAQRLGLEPIGGFRDFPGSLMGVIAYVDQTLLDTRHYRDATVAYEKSPAGRTPPRLEASLDALARDLDAGRPFWLPAHRDLEIDRALALASDHDLRAVIVGGQGAYERVDALAAAEVPVLVSLDWPEAEKGRDPKADVDFRDLYHRRMAVRTPRRLSDAGVPFAFYSGGLAEPEKVFAGVRAAIEAGLDEADALRAMTADAAGVLGVDASLGTITKGKLAHLVLATAPPWAEEAEVRGVMVGRRWYAERAEKDSDEKDGEKDSGSPAEDQVAEVAPSDPASAGEESEPTEVTAVEETAETQSEPSDEELVEGMARYFGPAREMGDFAIVGATVYTVTGDVIENGTVLVRDGEIAAVGPDVEVPGGVETIDAAGGSLIPGIVDAHSHIAIDGAGNEGSLAVTSMVTIQDVVDPHDIAIYRALAGGVTTVNVLHGSANPIGGGNAVLKLRWGANADGMRFDGAPSGIKFALGENPKRARGGGGPQRYPATRMGVMDVIRQAFVEARAYREAWREHEAAVARGENPVPPRRDRELETLAEVLDGERLVHAHSYRADEILQLLRLAEEFDFRVATLQHVLEGYKVADEIAAHGAGASTFSDWWGYKVEAYDAIPHNAALMTERGVIVSINSDSAEEMRHLNQEAAKTIRWGGLDENQALRLVTLNPAIQLGLDDRIGSIEVGKDADLVLYDGHPLSTRSVVQKTFVDGDLYFDRELDRERQAAIEALEARLTPPEKGDGEGKDANDAPGGPPDPAEAPKTYPMDYTCHLHEGAIR